MKVLTLDNALFSRKCVELRELVAADGFDYDAVVAIASGGVYVARAFMDGNPRNSVCFEVDCRRTGTDVKKRRLSKLVGALPRWVADLLRIAESRVYEVRRRFSPSHLKHVELPASLVDYLREKPRNLLIIDDAVDSGVTLASVVEAIAGVGVGSQVRTAVITVTTGSPLINADYALFRDSTLVRFPWSLDS